MTGPAPTKVAHLTTVDSSLRFLLFPQLAAIEVLGGMAIGISAPGPYVEGLEADGVRHFALASSTRGMHVVADLRAAWELWHVLRREGIDVLHTHNPKPGLYGRVVGRLARVPIVVNTVHGLYATDDDGWAKRIVVYGLEAFAARCSDAELLQNPEDLALMTRWHIVRPHRARLLGNGVDLERFDPTRFSTAEREGARAELGAGPGDVVVGTVGRLVAEKGYPELFEAARTFGPGVVLAVVGPDDPEKSDRLDPGCITSAAEHGARFLGMRDDVDRLYSAFDVFVLPSHREGFPRAAMEAAAMRLPLVTTDIRGCRQVVDDGVTGFLVPVGDPAALGHAVRVLAGDPVLRATMGTAGRAKAVAEFDEREVVRIVLETYRDIARRKGLELFGRAPNAPGTPDVRS
jgi:glycosyltransferase involved in cell wall biosynthesis